MTAGKPRQRVNQSLSSLVSWFDENISTGRWPLGMKLPTERQLEEQLHISRNTLRKGLRKLEAEGKIARQVGRGSFVTGQASLASGSPPPAPMIPPALGDMALAMAAEGPSERRDLFDRISGASPVDLMEVRSVLEPAAAELAALRASASALDRMQEALRRSGGATAIADFEHWDGVLHMTIIAAARNELLSAIYDAINRSRQNPEWIRMKERSVTPERRILYHDQHRELVEAMRARDPDRARAAAVAHLVSVKANLFSS